MQVTFPSYYNAFSCIADACPDTCCAGWQIMIDDRSLKNTAGSRVLSETGCTMTSTGRSMRSASTGIGVPF